MVGEWIILTEWDESEESNQAHVYLDLGNGRGSPGSDGMKAASGCRTLSSCQGIYTIEFLVLFLMSICTLDAAEPQKPAIPIESGFGYLREEEIVRIMELSRKFGVEQGLFLDLVCRGRSSVSIFNCS